MDPMIRPESPSLEMVNVTEVTCPTGTVPKLIDVGEAAILGIRPR
jgi:hypothetical protein